MKKQTAEDFIITYPLLFKGKLPRSGFYVGQGWYNLLHQLCVVIESHLSSLPEELRSDISVLQIKEKFGGLRFYVDHSTPFMDGAISLAETQSYYVCEECGNPGQRRPGGYIQVLCDKHFKAREKRKKEKK